MKHGLVRLVMMVVLVLLAYSANLSAQNEITQALTVSETLEKIVAESNRIPLGLYPPGHLEWLQNGVHPLTTAPTKSTSKTSKFSVMLGGGGSSQMMMQSSGQLERRYHVVDLGALNGYVVQPRAINDRGEIVGYVNMGTFLRAIYYFRGLIENMGTLGGSQSVAVDINNQGVIIGWANSSGEIQRSFLYTNSVMVDLSTILEGVLMTNVSVNKINNNNEIVGDAHIGTNDYHHPFVYLDGLTQDLGTLGVSGSSAYGINDYGQIVGAYVSTNNPSTSVGNIFLYSGGIISYITDTESFPAAINNHAQITGIILTINSIQAFLYSGNVIYNLGTLGGLASIATSMNDQTYIIGHSQISSGDYRPFIYFDGVMDDINDLVLTEGWTIQEVRDINNLGQIVGLGINSNSQIRGVLLNPVPLGWEETLTNTPVTPTYTPLPAKAAGKTNLIVVTHGSIPPWQFDSVEESIGWIHEMTNSITRYLATNNIPGWQVVAYQWTNEARWGISGPKRPLDRSKDIGEYLGSQVATQGWAHIHMITHSAGAGLIQSIADKVATNANLTVHTTFLDPFFGFDQDGKDTYGRNADWSDQYFARDITGGYTRGIAKHTHNVDVTSLDTNKTMVRVHEGAADSVGFCTKTTTSHDWPIQFYLNSFLTNSFTNYQGFGFPLSKEGGRWSYALSQYVTNNNPARILGTPDDCPDTAAIVDTIAHILPLSPLTQFLIESATGSIQKHINDFVATTGSPVWLAQFVTPTNTVNFVSFDAQFLSVTGSQGVVTIYWDTNIIGTIDGRIVKNERRQYSFPFPRTAGSLSYMFGVRLDPLTSTQSSIQVSNVVVGLTGPAQPFKVNQTTNMSNGLKVWELTGPSGYEYVAQVSTNLIDWQGIAVLRNTNGSVRFVDPGSSNSVRRFHRAVVP